MESATSQPEREHPHVQITVHEFHNSTLATRVSQEDVLRIGEQIVNSATSMDLDWKSVQIIQPEAILQTGKGYVFNRTPPSIETTTHVSYDLKEWGSAVTEDEVYTLDDLEEFNPSELGHISMVQTAAEETPTPISTPAPSLETGRKRVGDEEFSVEPEAKRRKLWTGSLFRVIPQPHMHPSMFDMTERTFKSAFRKLRPKFIAPYTKDTFPSNSRLGWLIPIRGSFPWEGCTPGEMLDSADNASPTCLRNSECISWSEDALLKFWNYLLELRKSGKLGRLAVSFHPYREPKPLAQSSRSALLSDTSILIRPTETSPPFFKTDFIKVYHNAQNAMYVRRALDLFSYRYTHDDKRVEKVRMLKGVRLALVNDVSQGVLVV